MSKSKSENAAAEDANKVESVEMLTDLAADYAEYMQINCLKEVFGFHTSNCWPACHVTVCLGLPYLHR